LLYSRTAITNSIEEDGRKLDDFVPIDDQLNDPEIMNSVLGHLSDKCTLNNGDGSFKYVIDNCQGFTQRMRNRFQEKVGENCSEIATQTEQAPTVICRVPKDFWTSHERKIGPVTMTETNCVINGPVMTRVGEVDGTEWCGLCSRSSNGLLPDKRPCSQPEDPKRRNPVPPCPNH